MKKSNLREIYPARTLKQSHFKTGQLVITLFILMGLTVMSIGLTSCGGGSDATATSTETNCVLGSSSIGNCKI